jgi:hypothetical protein
VRWHGAVVLWCGVVQWCDGDDKLSLYIFNESVRCDEGGRPLRW